MSTLKPKDLDYVLRAITLLVIWTAVGWLPMAVLGFALGYLLGGGTNVHTTGGALWGIFLYIPLGILGYWIYLKRSLIWS